MATPTLVQHTSSAYHRLGTGDDSVNGMKFTLPNAVLSGNCLIVGITYPYSVSRTISLADTNGTWGSPAITTSDTTLGVSMSIFVLPNATAGIHTITVTFDTALVPVQYRASEFYNVATATPVDGSHGNAAATAPNVDAGSLSVSTNNDANGGHLVWAMFADRDFPAVAATAMTGFTPGSSFSLLDADRIPLGTPIISMPNASEYRVVSTFATFPITPGITASGHTDDYIGCAVALKAAAAGTAPAAGIRIIRVLHQSHDSPPASFAMQAPMDGNLMVLVTSEQQTVVVSGVVDNYSNTYTQYEDSDTSVPQFWVAKNVTPHNDLTITISQTGSAGRSYTLYDITGADTTSPVDGTAHTTAFTNSTGANITDTPVLTPASANGLTIAAGSNGLGPTSGLDTGAPAGAVFDFVYYTAETDNSNMDNADMRAHVYNSDLSTQHWNWVTANGSQSTSQSAMAVHFKVAVASTPATSDEPLAAFDPELVARAWFDAEVIVTRGWFDVELLGPVTVYETKGAFSAELIVKGWFDEELIAKRNWFDVELPAAFDPGNWPWIAVLPERLLKPFRSLEWTDRMFSPPVVSFNPTTVLPERFARASWNPERSDTARAGWTQALWAVPPTKIPEPVLPERQARPAWDPERSRRVGIQYLPPNWPTTVVSPERNARPQWDPERTASTGIPYLPPTWPTTVVAPERQARPAWSPERSHSVGIPYLPPTWPTTVVAPERNPRPPWTPERSETARAGWIQALWAIAPQKIPEPVLPERFVAPWRPPDQQPVWPPFQFSAVVVPTWGYEVLGPQGSLRPIWNPERSASLGIPYLPPTWPTTMVAPERVILGWNPERGGLFISGLAPAAPVPVFGYEVLGPQRMLFNWNPERSDTTRAGWIQSLWAIPPQNWQPLLPTQPYPLIAPDRSALCIPIVVASVPRTTVYAIFVFDD